MSAYATQQPPPTPPVGYAGYSAHGSIGPVIGVLAVVLFLCVVAVVIGRICFGRTIMGYGDYNMESWVESKCATCVDGRIVLSPPAIASSGDRGEGTAEGGGMAEQQSETKTG